MTQPRRELYEQWVRQFAPELYRFAYRLTGQREKAEDILQETFVEAWKSLDQQRDPQRARAWLFQILRFRFAHLVRDERHEPSRRHLPVPGDLSIGGRGGSARTGAPIFNDAWPHPIRSG